MLRASSGSTSAIFTLRQDRARSCWDLLHVAVLAAVPHVDYQVASTTAVADQLSWSLEVPRRVCDRCGQ